MIIEQAGCGQPVPRFILIGFSSVRSYLGFSVRLMLEQYLLFSVAIWSTEAVVKILLMKNNDWFGSPVMLSISHFGMYGYMDLKYNVQFGAFVWKDVLKEMLFLLLIKTLINSKRYSASTSVKYLCHTEPHTDETFLGVNQQSSHFDRQ